MFPSISSILYFLGHPWEFSTPLTALVDDDKQLDDGHKDTSQSGATWQCFGHHIYPLDFNIPAQELHYFPALQGHWGNLFNTVEQIKMLNEYRSLSSL